MTGQQSTRFARAMSPLKLRSSKRANDRPEIVWVTNAVPPYRKSLFELMAKSHSLTVLLTGGSTGVHDWSAQSSSAYTSRRLSLAACPWNRVTPMMLGKWEDPRVYLIAMLRALLRLPTVAFYESTALTHKRSHGPVAWARSAFFRVVDGVLTVGTASTNAVLDMGVSPDRILTGFNAVDGDYFSAGTKSARSRTAASRAGSVIYMGQLIERKNIRVALEAWAQVRTEGDKFIVAGRGPLEGSLKGICQELGIEDSVDWLGYLSPAEACNAFAEASTLVLPSTEEVWGLVVNEALAAGLHVVVSDRAGVAASVRGMRGVYVVSPKREGLVHGLLTSRREWRGPVLEPEILGFGPAELASAALKICDRVK